jgi:tryptophan halogenase
VTDEGTYYGNFDAEFRNFWTNGSYYSVFAGLGVLPEHPLPALSYRPESVRGAEPLFEKVKREQRDLVATLPTNLEFLRQLHGR